MKELYEELKLEVIRFKTEDIITTSDAATSNNDQTQTSDAATDNNQSATNGESGGNNNSGVIKEDEYYPTVS